MPSSAPVRERPRDFLFDREEEAGTGKEGDDPHHRQRRERVRTERPGGDGEEGVGGDAGDDESRADGERSLGQRVGSQGGEAARRSSGDGLLLRFRVGVKHRSHARFRRHHPAWRERPNDGSATLTDVSAYDAVLVVSFGGPEGPDDVMPFLENVTRGRDIPPGRLRAVAAQYERFGGVSPINGQNRRSSPRSTMRSSPPVTRFRSTGATGTGIRTSSMPCARCVTTGSSARSPSSRRASARTPPAASTSKTSRPRVSRSAPERR